jgi:hypothetical protein
LASDGAAMPEKLTDISLAAGRAVSPPPQADSRAAVALPPASGSNGALDRNLRRLRRVDRVVGHCGYPEWFASGGNLSDLV